MKTLDTYYIKRNNCFIWLSHNESPISNDEVVEIRPIVIADEGKVLIANDQITGTMVWNRDNLKLAEIDMPKEDEEEEITDVFL